MIKKKIKKKDNIIDFPKKPTSLEKEIEAIIFAAAEPLDIETIQSKISTKTDIEKVLLKLQSEYSSRGINLVCISKKWSFRTSPNLSNLMIQEKTVEKKLLRFKPGITDFASIVFSDESEILKNVGDPDITYNQLIRPWKSRLGLFYIEKQSLIVDILIIILTLLNSFSRRTSLFILHKIMRKLNAPKDLAKFVLREEKLKPLPPPGSNQLIFTRDLDKL